MSEETRTFVLFAHPDGVNCREAGRSYRKKLYENDDATINLECWKCDSELVEAGEEEVSAEFPEVSPEIQEFIEGLTDYERAVYLGMVMESLRGNWSTSKRRLGIIGAICEEGVGDELSDEFMERTENRARGALVKERGKYQHFDGRRFRGESNGCYGKLWREVEKDEDLMRRFIGYIPNDKTWQSRLTP